MRLPRPVHIDRRRGALLLALITIALVALGTLLGRSEADPARWSLRDAGLLNAAGLHPAEQTPDRRVLRWTNGDASIVLPVRHGGGRVTLDVLIPPQQPGPVNLALGDRAALVLPPLGERSLQLLVPSGGDALDVRIASPTFRAPPDSRELGVVLFDIGWQRWTTATWQALIRPIAGWALALSLLALVLAGALTIERRGEIVQAQRGKPRLVFIDGLRGIAVMGVVIAHSWIHTSRFSLGLPIGSNLGMLSIGVNLFMVISGFCLAYPLIRPDSIAPVRIGHFWERRFLRIAPPYYMAIALLALMFFVTSAWYPALGVQHAPAFTTPTLPIVGSHLLFIHNPLAYWLPPLNGSFWSLELELQFYLLFPLLIAAARRWGALRMVVGVLALTLLWRLAIWYTLPRDASPAIWVALAWSAPGRLFEFALGILAAVLLVQRPERLRPLWLLLIALVSLWLAVFQLVPRFGQFAPFPDIVIGLGMWALLLAGTRGPLLRLLEWQPLVWIGTISYSIYLTHEPLLEEFYRWFPEIQGWAALGVYTLIGGAVCVIIGYGFYAFVEHPSIRLGGRVAARQAHRREQASEVHAAP